MTSRGSVNLVAKDRLATFANEAQRADLEGEDLELCVVCTAPRANPFLPFVGRNGGDLHVLAQFVGPPFDAINGLAVVDEVVRAIAGPYGALLQL